MNVFLLCCEWILFIVILVTLFNVFSSSKRKYDACCNVHFDALNEKHPISEWNIELCDQA